ncbi:MAG: hypothetical protein ACYSU4_11260 [Planctomycetota bacterium]|jgi:hypothetical protein
MRFIRKYAALLVPTGILLVAVVLFVPTLLAGRSISKSMESSIADGRKLASMRSKTPCKAQAEVEKLYQGEHKKDADEIVQLSRRSTQRELISYKIFPKPKDTSQQVFVQFGAQYRATIEELVKSMNALDAPRDIDIKKEIEGEGSGGGSVIGGRFGRIGTTKAVGTKKGSSNAIVDAVCNKRAESVPVYANPNSFAWYGFWENYKYSGLDAAIKNCWHSQVAYWIYEDVVATINEVNSESDCVYTSGVKRLVGVSFSKPVEYVNSINLAVVGPDAPDYVMDKGVSVLGAEPWTGRMCDADIDVVHFAVSVIVDTKSFMPFIKELCGEKEHRYREGYLANGPERVYKHNQITVLQSKIEPVDRTATQHEFYRYGDGAIVQLSLVCEYIFNRSIYDKIKPEPIKVLLGQSAVKDVSGKGGK